MMKSLVVALALSSTGVWAAAAPGDSGKFGLDCVGVTADGVKHTTAPYRARMSIDVDRGRFCYLPACNGLYELGPVTDSQIRLFDHPLASNYLEGNVDRQSGALDLIMQSSLANDHVTGRCTWTAFTPFAADAKPVYLPNPFPGDRALAAPPRPVP